MTHFNVNPVRSDPYKNFRFRVLWDGRTAAGVNGVHLPSLNNSSPLLLERGISYDPAFDLWAAKVRHVLSDKEAGGSFEDFRKDLRIEMFNEAGQLVVAYLFYRCWPSDYTSQHDADGSESALIQSMTLQHEGWERDVTVVEPHDPEFSV